MATLIGQSWVATWFFLAGHLASCQMTGGSGPIGSQSNSDLAYYPARVSHTYGCANGGVWNGSCDIDMSMKISDATVLPTIFAVADWSEGCDPWKGVTETRTLEYNSSFGVWVSKQDGRTKSGWSNEKSNWTCPAEQRSMSGCGDFRTDTRNLTCTSTLNLFSCGRPLNADRRIYDWAEIPVMAVPQRHVCMQHPIFYDNLARGGSVIPPALGRHRERWAKWGEYDYLPPQRWLHNAEHGGVVFLYNQCLDQESLCAIRRYIQKWQKRIGKIQWQGSWGDTDDEFRFLLTPFKDLWTPIAIVAWGHVYGSKCFNEHDMDYFIEKSYRSAFEDWPPNGAYNYLWKDISETATSCAELPTSGTAAANHMLSVQETEIAELHAVVNDLKAQLAILKDQAVPALATNSSGSQSLLSRASSRAASAALLKCTAFVLLALCRLRP